MFMIFVLDEIDYALLSISQAADFVLKDVHLLIQNIELFTSIYDK